MRNSREGGAIRDGNEVRIGGAAGRTAVDVNGTCGVVASEIDGAPAANGPWGEERRRTVGSEVPNGQRA